MLKVSILMITYNHEKFIAQALNSVLMQQVDFLYEIVVGEDCSTDSTRQILLDYAYRFPDKIRLLLPDTNLGMMSNFITTMNACRGDYIALLEGDDFWTDENKLQKQINFLDSHPECSGCFHNVLMLHEDEPRQDRIFHNPPLQKRFFSQKDIVAAHFIPTCSTVFRSGLFNGFPEWFMDMPMGDWPLHVLNSEHGPYAYINEVMASYRVHTGGTWSGKSRLRVLNMTIRACRILKQQLAGRYSREFGLLIRVCEIEASQILMSQADFIGATKRLFYAYLEFPASFTQITKCFWYLAKSCFCNVVLSRKLVN